MVVDVDVVVVGDSPETSSSQVVYVYDYDYDRGSDSDSDYGSSRGCGCNGSKDYSRAYATGTGTWASTAGTPAGGYSTASTVETEIGVEVLGEAVVGPFAIEVISAVDAVEFADWLTYNGYDLPEGAVDPLQHYIDLGMSFLGVKLAPDVPEGPIDTLTFTCPAPAPQIPLILTSIASANDLTIQAWVLANEPYVPSNWATADDVAATTLPRLETNDTDYLPRVEAAISAHGGQAFALEYAGWTDPLEIDDLLIEATIKQHPYITRYRGFIHPWEMTVDPEFAPFPGLPDYSNEHVVVLDFGQGDTPTTTGSGAWLLLPLPLLALFRRRRD